jgi:hypothetical protein
MMVSVEGLTLDSLPRVVQKRGQTMPIGPATAMQTRNEVRLGNDWNYSNNFSRLRLQ